MVSKKDIRKYVLSQRKCMTERDWDEKSRIIFERVVNHPFFLESNTIYCYVHYNQEVQTRAIIEYAWDCNKKVAVPKIVEDEMLFYYIQSFDDLSLGYRGILEPNNCQRACKKAPLIIMPGVAFDSTRNRIGYGKGFYDKFLRNHPQSHSIALAFELQLLPSIQAEEFDIKPEILITEERIYD